MFTVYLALFNAFSTLLNQIMLPRGYSADNAGLTGALLIVAGLVCSAIVSPIIDRTRSYFITLRICIPLIAVSYIAFIFAPNKGAIAAPFVVAAILGATSFCLLPMALELCVEYTYPVAPEWTSSLLWCGGQLFGAVAILVMDALKTKDGDMKWALVFQAAVAVIVAPGAFMAKRKNVLKRLEADGSV